MTFTVHEREYLAAQPLGRISTSSPSGQPDVAPVTFELEADATIVVGGLDLPKTLKYRNLARNPLVAFVVDDLASTQPWRPRGVKIHGTARLDTGADGRPVIRITPGTVWSWGLNPDAPKHFSMVEKRKG